MKLGGWLLAAALSMPACARAADVTVSKPWMRYLLPSIPASGYLVLQNSGNADETLTAAASPACGMLMLHQSQEASGTAMMMDVTSVDIPAHGSVAFSPGGYHLMCMQPKMKPGDKIPVTLTLQSGATINFTAPVYGASQAP